MRLSPAEMRKLLNRKVVEQAGKCGICHHEFADCSDIVPDHTDTRKGWEEPGEMTIRKTSKPCIGGATGRRVPSDWVNESGSVFYCELQGKSGNNVCRVWACRDKTKEPAADSWS